MNCVKCQNLLSEFVDGDCTLSGEVRAHLEVCEICTDVFRDFSDLTQFCSTYQEQEIIPPNSQALWCRISNIIESEEQAPIAPVAEEKAKRSFWAGVWQANWQFSLSQVVSAVIGIALVSSLLTVIGLRNSVRPDNNLAADVHGQPSLFDSMLTKVGLADGHEQIREKDIAEKQAVIDYWNSRVEERRAQWNQKMRDTFDRNLREIDQVLVEYTQNLKENPEDSLSEEMFNSALTEKMELLREFSEL